MRCVQTERFGYIFNFWAQKTAPMRMDSTSGLTFKAMQEAGESDPKIAARVRLFEHRVAEELYDFNEAFNSSPVFASIRYVSDSRKVVEIEMIFWYHGAYDVQKHPRAMRLGNVS